MGYAEAIEQQAAALVRMRSHIRGAQSSEDRDAFLRAEIPLAFGDAFAVAPAICDLIGAAALTVPRITLVPELFVSRIGWVWFERPFPMPDMTSEDYHPLLAALSWVAVADGIELAVYMTRAADGRPLPHMHLQFPWLFGRDVLGMGSSVQSIRGEFVSGFTEYGIYLLVLLLFMRQQILVTTQRAIQNRSTRRRVARVMTHEPVVHVVELRRREYQQHDESQGSGVEYTCQWLVRGHWRQHFFPASGEHRPLWIAPHVKGPSDKPLRVAAQTAYAVVR